MLSFDLLISSLLSKIITIDEAKRRQSFGSCDCDLSAEALPMLSDTSDLLQDTDIEKVSVQITERNHVLNAAASDLRSVTSSRPLSPLSSPVACQLACRVTPGDWPTAL